MKIKEFVRVQTKKPERIALRLSHDDDDDRRKIGITGGEGAEGGGGMDTKYNIIMIFVDGRTDGRGRTDSP